MKFVSCILKKEEVSSAETWATIYRQTGVHDYCTMKLHPAMPTNFIQDKPMFLLGEWFTSVTR